MYSPRMFSSLSRVAAMAILTATASMAATPLTETLKADGMLQYEFKGVKIKNPGFNKTNKDADDTASRFYGDVGLIYTPTDMVELKLGAQFDNRDVVLPYAKDGETRKSKGDLGETYAKFYYQNYVGTIGKLRLNTPFNDMEGKDSGLGARIEFQPEDLTVKGNVFYYDRWKLHDYNPHLGDDNKYLKSKLYGFGFSHNNEYAAGNLWVAKVTDVAKLMVELDTTLKMEGGYLRAGLGYAELELADKGQKKNLAYVVEGGMGYEGSLFRIGFIGSGGDGYRVSLDNNGWFTQAGRQWNNQSHSGINFSALSLMDDGEKDNSLGVAYAAIDAPVDMFLEGLSVGGSLLKGSDEKTIGKDKVELSFTEFAPYVAYKYKGAQLEAYYSMMQSELEFGGKAAGAKTKEHMVGFKATYKF